jgi:ABC-type phosphate transport system auxiliary subunit
MLSFSIWAMTISVVADICFLFIRLVVLLRRMIHTTPIAAIKQNTPPTAAPIIMLGFVLADSLPELELKLLALVVPDAVFSGAVPS